MIADLFAQSFAATSIDGLNPRDPGISRLFGLGPLSTSGAEVTTKTALGLSQVFRAVNIIGNAVWKCRPIIYKRLPDAQGREKERAMGHPNWRFVTREANEFQSAGDFRKTLTVNAMMQGNGIGYCFRDGAGLITDAIPLLPDRTGMAVFDDMVLVRGATISEDSPFPRDVKTNILYWTIVGGQMRTLLPENIIHIKNLTYNGIWGIDIQQLMRETFGLGIALRESASRFFGQGMLSSGVLYMPPGLKDELKQELFVKGIKDQAQGLTRAHRLLVVEEGAKYEPMSVNPQLAQAIESRELAGREIANILGCQAHKLGDTKRSSYASLEQANQEHLDDDIDPWLQRWEEALEEVALAEDEEETGSYYIECNRKALLRTNLAARTAYYTFARGWGVASANDILAAEGEDSIGPQGDIYLSPINMQSADQIGQQVVAPTEHDVEPEETVSMRNNYRTLATHETTRLIKRVCDEAVRRSAQGGAEFVAFIEQIDSQCQEPAPLRPLLEAVGNRLAYEFDRFTQLPYTSPLLKENVAAAIDRIRTESLRDAAERLEQVA